MESAIEEIKNIFKVHNICDCGAVTFWVLNLRGNFSGSEHFGALLDFCRRLLKIWAFFGTWAHLACFDLGLSGYFWACFGTFGHKVSKVPKKTMVDQECPKVSKLLQCLKLKNNKRIFCDTLWSKKKHEMCENLFRI